MFFFRRNGWEREIILPKSPYRTALLVEMGLPPPAPLVPFHEVIFFGAEEGSGGVGPAVEKNLKSELPNLQYSSPLKAK